MTPLEALLLAVAVMTIPAATRNFTALALVVWYAVYEIGWQLTHREFHPFLCVIIDATVIAAIYCKEPAHECWPYHDRWHQFRALWLERSLWDRIVIAVFPLMWLCYALRPSMSEGLYWHSLYWLTMAQFVAANCEALHFYLRDRSAKSGETRPDLTGMRFIAVVGGGYG